MTGGLLCQRLGRGCTWTLELAGLESRHTENKSRIKHGMGGKKRGKKIITEGCGGVCSRGVIRARRAFLVSGVHVRHVGPSFIPTGCSDVRRVNAEIIT